jgi:ribosomal protein L16 Arg81 hydroxylase
MTTPAISSGSTPIAATPTISSSDLDWLVAPLDVREFAAEFYEKRACVVRRGQPGYYAGLLSLADLDRVLGTHAPYHPDVNVVAAGREIRKADFTDADGRVDALRVARLFGEGATLVFGRLDRRLPALAALCGSLSRAFTSRMQTNVYLTPPGAQGFPAHWDTHDVFVLQAAGRKHWTIYDAPTALPLRGQEFDPERHAPGATTLEFTLEAGDMAYIPRGHFHSARSDDQTSLHLTTGLIAFTWTDVLLHAVQSVAESDPALRENLPIGFLAEESAGRRAALLRQRLERFVGHAIDAAPFEYLGDEVIAHWEPCLTDLLSQVEAARELEDSSRVRTRPGAVWAYREGGEECVLGWHGRQVRFPGFTAPALRFVLETPVFRVCDLPDALDGPGKLTLIRRLIQEGFLECLAVDAASSPS